MDRIVVAGLVLMLSGCATTRELYVVMPETDGRVGTVVVTTADGRETVLHGAYSSIESGATEVRTADAAVVRRSFAAALEATPVRPETFIVYFQADSERLTPASESELPAIARRIIARPAPEVTLVGHADTTQSEAYNDELSRRRAERIRTELGRLGVPARDIEVLARGERQLLVPTPDDRHEPRNRRVEIEVR